jgi:signal transduction histidine kinase
MKPTAGEFVERYGRALRRFVAPAAGASLLPALRLGKQAVGLGLEPLAIARVHEQGILRLPAKGGTRRRTARGELFFASTILPVVETHRAAIQSRSDLSRLNKTLALRTTELCAMQRQLKRGSVRRKTVEVALKASGERYARLLKESLKLQTELRTLTHRVFATQEDERLKLSRKLQNEIAQTLIGIHVRLTSMKREARNSTKGFRTQIHHTQQLVRKSARSLTTVADSIRSL